jgi:hypothetical protein
MQVAIRFYVEGNVRLTDFESTAEAVDHVARTGDISRLTIEVVEPFVRVAAPAQVSSTTVKRKNKLLSGVVTPPAQPVGGGENPGSVEEASFTSVSAGTDAPAVAESSVEPERVVTISMIRTEASALMQSHTDGKAQLAALLAKYGVTNLTSLGEKTSSLAAFYVELLEASA